MKKFKEVKKGMELLLKKGVVVTLMEEIDGEYYASGFVRDVDEDEKVVVDHVNRYDRCIGLGEDGDKYWKVVFVDGGNNYNLIQVLKEDSWKEYDRFIEREFLELELEDV